MRFAVTQSAQERLEAKYEPEPNSGCWLWTGANDGKGYGFLWLNGKNERAHRVSYAIYRRVIPDGMTIDHLCRNRSCVNPAHLEAVSMRENILRGDGLGAKRARQTGCKHGHPFGSGRRCLVCRRAWDRRNRGQKKA